MKKIMVVDDEPDIRKGLSTILRKNGFEVITADDGDDCLKKLEGTKVDFILMDIMMPGTPVKKVIPKIKGTKVAFISVVQTSEVEKENLLGHSNVVDFIQKPFDIDELIRKINKYTG